MTANVCSHEWALGNYLQPFGFSVFESGFCHCASQALSAEWIRDTGVREDDVVSATVVVDNSCIIIYLYFETALIRSSRDPLQLLPGWFSAGRMLIIAGHPGQPYGSVHQSVSCSDSS